MKLTKSIWAFALFAPMILADTTVLFAPNSPATGPFPSNALTLPNTSQKTSVQVNMPTSSCNAAVPPSSCTNALLLNQLDGFSVNPQIVVCFSGAIDVGTLAGGIQIVPVTKSGRQVAINRILYDPTSNCAYAKPDQVLAQQTEYLLTVDSSVLDTGRQKVKADPQFTACMNGGSAYCTALSAAVNQMHVKGGLVGASLFTTMSATDWLEKAQAFVNQPSTPVAALPAGAQSLFTMSEVSGLTWTPDYGVSQTTPQPIPLNVLHAVDRVAFGLYLSPNFINVSGALAGTISVTPTGIPISGTVAVGPTPFPPGYVPVSYHVFLPPARLMPPGGFPVVIYGHGLADNQFGASTFIASTFASAGIATLCIEIPGHGFGPNGTVQVGFTNGSAATVLVPGRGVQFNQAAPIGSTDGCIIPGPIGVRDCARQTAVDLFALVRTIRATNGLNLGLDVSRIYFVGQSFGGIYGTLFHATEPAIKAAVLNVAGGSSVDASRLAPLGRQVAAYYLGTSNPPLLNALPYGPAPQQDYFHDSFNDNYVYRDMGPVINYPAPAGPSVVAVDNALEIADWLNMNGDPLAFAFKLKNQPAPGIVGKSTLIQFAFGDLEVPNPTNSALIRAAGLQSSSWLFRFDVAAAQANELLTVSFDSTYHFPSLPHAYLSNPTLFTGIAAEDSIAMAVQQQAAAYFMTGGIFIPNPNWFLTGVFAGKTLFEVPATLPEQLNFIQITKW